MSLKILESVVRSAVLGLLAAAASACGGDSDDEASGKAAGELEGAPADSANDGATGGSEAASASAENVEGVVSSKTIADLSLAAFTEMCDEVRGVVEIHASCGGVVSGRGFSYDSDTDQLTEHTCRGFNTCTGFSCVVDDA